MQEAAAAGKEAGACHETCITLGGKRSNYEGVEHLTCCQGERLSAVKFLNAPAAGMMSVSASKAFDTTTNGSATQIFGSNGKLSVTKSALKATTPMQLPGAPADINGENTESQEESHH
jgi:hypothetical protein